MRIPIAIVLVVWMVAGAGAETLGVLSGRVRDQRTGVAVERALVMIAGPNGHVTTLETDREGGYRTSIVPGTYHVIFAFGSSRTSGKVVVEREARLDGVVEASVGEIIEVHGKLPEPTPPKVTNFRPERAPPYSDAAVLHDAWTRAHLLLDVDERGVVRRYKFVKRPGHDLEAIAGREVSKLTFEPAKDPAGKPMRSWVVWTIEWPSAWWLEMSVGTRTRMPMGRDHYVPCSGSGPWASTPGRFLPWYKDCSKPDLSKAGAAAWVDVR